mgnify:FL=1
MEVCTLDERREKYPMPWALGWDSAAGQSYYKDANGVRVDTVDLLNAINTLDDWSHGCAYCGDSR